MSRTEKELSGVVRPLIVALQAQLAAPQHSSLSHAELTDVLSAKVDAWHAMGEERIAADLQQLATGQEVDMLVPVDTYGHTPNAYEQAVETRAWLTFAIGKDAMLAKFKPTIDALPAGAPAAERARQQAELQRKLVDAEVREDALIRQAEKEGAIIDPRPGQRPEAAILIGWGT